MPKLQWTTRLQRSLSQTMPSSKKFLTFNEKDRLISSIKDCLSQFTAKSLNEFSILHQRPTLATNYSALHLTPTLLTLSKYWRLNWLLSGVDFCPSLLAVASKTQNTPSSAGNPTDSGRLLCNWRTIRTCDKAAHAVLYSSIERAVPDVRGTLSELLAEQPMANLISSSLRNF